MPLDAIVLNAIAEELQPCIVGAKLDKITMPEKDTVILSLHTRDGKKKLLLSVRPGSGRVHLTNESFENPSQPPMFCMLLRKHLLGGRITGIEQPFGERLLLLRIDAVDELELHSGKTLAVELMGKALNLVLIGEDGRILDCLRRVDYEGGAKRPLLPGIFYLPPPKQEKPSFFETDEESFNAMAAHREGDADRWLLNTFGGLSPMLCRELAQNGWEGLPDAARSLRGRIAEKRYEPCLLREGGKPKDFSFLPITQYGDRVELTVCDSFSAMLDSFYAEREHDENLRRRGSELHKLAKTNHDRLVRKLAARKQELLATENRELYRKRGELITANIYRLKRGMKSFETQDYYEPDCPTVTIPLDELKTPQQNAAQNYKLYNKAKTAAGVLTGLIEEAESESAYLATVLDELERAESDRDLADIRRELIATGYIREKTGAKRQKLPAPRKPMRFVTEHGSEILVGRGNAENDELTLHTARRTDLWFHVQKVPGSHVVLSQAERVADEDDIRTAATLAVTFSHARDAGKTAVDYTMIRNVKKPAHSRPGHVIFSDYTTVIASADEALAQSLRAERK